MQIKKNWFSYFSLSIYLTIILYILICSIGSLGVGQTYSYYLQGVILFILLGVWLAIQLLLLLVAKLNIARFFPVGKKWVNILEFVIVLIVLGFSAYFRLEILQNLPMKPASDYKTYYEVANLLNKGTILTEGVGYCDYISMFPHVIGYSYVLSLIFRFFGSSVIVGQYFNVILALLTVVIVWRIGRLIGGRISGFVTLVLCAFWPSQILFNNFLSAEYLFTFLLSLCMWLYIVLMKKFDANTKKPGLGVVLHIVLGILLGITSAVRPMGVLLLVAIVICTITNRMKLANKPRNDLPVMLRGLEKGWIRCLLILGAYFICSQIISMNITNTIDRELPGTSASFGYNLLVGFNIEASGGWNEEDAHLLFDTLDRTGSAEQAHIVCRDQAFARLKQDINGSFNLFVKKFNVLWGNDDYGSSWNLLFLEQQDELTKHRETLLYDSRIINNFLYIITIMFSGVAGIYMWRKKVSYAYPFILVFIGTVVAHILLENQNRYHYHILQIFIILAGVGIGYIYSEKRESMKRSKDHKEAVKRFKDIELSEKEQMKENEEKERQSRIAGMSNTFDMRKAIEEGHVIMTVSEAYKDNTQQDKNEDVRHE